ncbi:MAG: serine hydrolase domain-containing protein [Gemmatimonadales bacterium]
MHRIIIQGLGWSLLVVRAAPAQTAPGLDSVDHYVRAELARRQVPGLSIAILRGDSVVLARGYGYANLEHRVPAADSTIYQSGSLGKQFTAAALVMLAEQGRLRLDDSIRRHLPEGPDSWRGITIRHLLTHTSGIPDYTDSTLDYRREYTEEQLVRLAARMALQFAPGERWSYSNTGYLLLGVIIHRVTGAFYGDFLRQHILGPLGMRTARVVTEADLVPNRAAGYQLVDGRIQNQEWVSPSLNTTADGSLYLTVRDLARWAIALNHSRVPSRAGLEAIWTPVRLNSGGTYPYGFGWMIEEQRGYRRIGHTGAWQGFRTSLQRYPDFDLTVIVLANLDEASPEALSFGIAGILEPALTAPHLLAAGRSGLKPPAPLAELISQVVARPDSARITRGLRALASAAMRKELDEQLKPVHSWTFVGCDDVGSRPIWRLGDRVRHICYARGTGAGASTLATVLYATDWRAAGIDFYEF